MDSTFFHTKHCAAQKTDWPGGVGSGAKGLEDFFSSFTDSFTAEEWRAIRDGYGPTEEPNGGGDDSGGDDGGGDGCGGGRAPGLGGQLARFYRFWALQEACVLHAWGC